MTAIFLGGVIAVVLVVVVLFWFSRRGRGQTFRPNNPEDLVPPAKDEELALSGPTPKIWPQEDPAPPPSPRIEAMGRLYVDGGGMTAQSFPVGGAPVSIGSNDSCAIRLSYEAGDEEQIAGEYLRVWVRDEQLMLHEVRKMTVTGSVGGRWAKLAPGDSLPVGPFTLRFELGAEEDPAKAQPVPNVLRDPAVVNEERDQLVSVNEAVGDESPTLNHFATPEGTPPNGVAATPEETPTNGALPMSGETPMSGTTED